MNLNEFSFYIYTNPFVYNIKFYEFFVPINIILIYKSKPIFNMSNI